MIENLIYEESLFFYHFCSSTVDLLKQLSYRCTNDETIMGVTFDEVG